MKACPYRRDHEWEWDGARQVWWCPNCYSECDKPEVALPIIDVTPPDSEKPTPPEPFPALGKDIHILNADSIRRYGQEGRIRVYRDLRGRYVFEKVK